MNRGIEFHTASCLNMNSLLRPAQRKEIILNSWRFLCQDDRIYLFGFVIMINHIHWLWEVKDKWKAKNVKQMFLKYTAQQIKFSLYEKELELYQSSLSDRNYQFWQRRSWRAQMFTREVLEQKLDYIHLNPVKARVVSREEDYKYSSASYYLKESEEFEFITHYMDRI